MPPGWDQQRYNYRTTEVRGTRTGITGTVTYYVGPGVTS